MKVNTLRTILATICILYGLTACKKSDHSTLSSEKAISRVTFKSSDNPGLASDVTANLTGDSVKIEFPPGVNLTNLVPTIDFTGKRITPANRAPQNFTNPVNYVVEAEDGTSRIFTFSSSVLDTAGLLLGRWNLVEDSISSINFYFSSGDIPISGIIVGKAEDYYEFYSNQSLYVNENDLTGTLNYQFLPNSQIFFGDAWALMGNATVLQLTSTRASFSWSTTSDNGGTYYRRVDLKR